MKHWKVSDTVHTCPHCLRPYSFLITDDKGRIYGCRASHAGAMDLARRKAKHYAELERRYPLAA